ncbi:VOC family protein [Patescibacteria group bacterium]|nr:VOC family protein [Patescibacteria group bacterium]
MPRVTHFEILADDPDRAVKFYQEVFDWKFEKWDGPMDYWMVMTGEGPGIDGGLSKRQAPIECKGIRAFVCTVDVDDIDNYIEKAKNAGGSIASEKQAIPSVGYMAQVEDSEGNVFGLMQEDKSIPMPEGAMPE